MATPAELWVPARYYLRLAEILPQFGIDSAQVLQTLELPATVEPEADTTIRFSQVDALIQQLSTQTVRTDLGFELGKLLTVSTHSIVGFGMLSSPNVEHSLRFVSRYFRLVMPSFRMNYRATPEIADVLFTPTIAMSHACLAFHLETIGMAALRDVRDLIGGRVPPCTLSFSIPRPAHARRYSALRNVEPRFGVETAPGIRLVFEANMGAIPLRMADRNALKVAEDRCRALVSHAARVREFSDWVTMTLREVAEGLPTLAELAAMLNISPRTLNRYLEREGTSFRQLAGRIQHELACERLASGKMTISEVAFSLGFNDPANFTRAFRDREGVSPREFRRSRSDAFADTTIS